MGETPSTSQLRTTSETVQAILERTRPQCMLPETAHCTGPFWRDWDATRRQLLVEIAALATEAVETLDRRDSGAA